MKFHLVNDEELIFSMRSLDVCECLAWSASRPVALWRFLALRYCVRHHFRAFGDHRVSGSLIGVMRAPLQVLVVLLYSAYRACSCSLLFKAPHPIPPFIFILFI